MYSLYNTYNYARARDNNIMNIFVILIMISYNHIITSTIFLRPHPMPILLFIIFSYYIRRDHPQSNFFYITRVFRTDLLPSTVFQYVIHFAMFAQIIVFVVINIMVSARRVQTIYAHLTQKQTFFFNSSRSVVLITGQM